MENSRVGRRLGSGRGVDRHLVVLMLCAIAGPIGCASEEARDPRKGAPVQPGNSATLGTDYGSLPKGKMYLPVPGTDVP